MDLTRVVRAGLGIALLATAGALFMYAQSAPELRFEVASVKRAAPDAPTAPTIGGPGTSIPLRFTARNVAFVILASHAYGLSDMFEVECKLPWMMQERYDVIANVPPGATTDEFRLMLQRLLQERLGLVVRRETRPMRGYRLVVAKNGPKLAKAAETPQNPHPDWVSQPIPGSFERMTRDGVTLQGRSAPMAWLVKMLRGRLYAPITDATGLEGNYDFSMAYAMTPDLIGLRPVTGAIRTGPPPPPAAPSAEAAAPSQLPSLWDAMQSDLGLKLEEVKNVPVEVIVLETANKEPTEN